MGERRNARLFWRVFACALAALALSAAPAAANMINVSSGSTDELTVGDGSCSLREAISTANGAAGYTECAPGGGADTINVPAGDYKLTLRGYNDDNSSGDLDVDSDMTIQGTGAGSTFIDGDQANAGGTPDRVFDVFGSATVAINAVTVENGLAPTSSAHVPTGGGILSGPASLTLNNDVVTQNAAGQGFGAAAGGNGGGIASSGTLTLNGTSLDHNHAGASGDATHAGGNGGGIFSSGTLNLTDSTVASNRAGDGASNVTGMTAGGDGGGIYASDGTTTTIMTSTIAANAAGAGAGTGGGGFGGGIFAANSTLGMTNSTVANNTSGNATGTGSGGVGGGVELYGSATLVNDTVAGNGEGTPVLAGGGGGIDPSGSFTHVKNSIIASNAPGGNCSVNVLTDDGHNLSFGDATCPGTFATGDPKLGPLQDNGGPTETMEISASGAAADQVPTVPAGTCPATDQRGILRPQGNACDIGAFEVRTYGLAVSKAGAGSGTVTSSSAGIDCGPSCNAQYDERTPLTLTATPAAGSVFGGFSGGGCSGTGPCTFAIGADTTVTASFDTGGGGAGKNTFSFGKLKRNARKGTATLTVSVPDAGLVKLGGQGVKGLSRSAPGAGAVKLLIKAKGKSKTKLDTIGKAKVKISVTFTPTGGTPNTESKMIKLIKR